MKTFSEKLLQKPARKPEMRRIIKAVAPEIQILDDEIRELDDEIAALKKLIWMREEVKIDKQGALGDLLKVINGNYKNLGVPYMRFHYSGGAYHLTVWKVFWRKNCKRRILDVDIRASSELPGVCLAFEILEECRGVHDLDSIDLRKILPYEFWCYVYDEMQKTETKFEVFCLNGRLCRFHERMKRNKLREPIASSPQETDDAEEKTA